MTAAIEVRRLSKRFGRLHALRPLDLTVEAGQVYGYLGPNGAGKTTTLRLLAGLLKPTGGQACVRGIDTWSRRDLAHRHIGYLPGDFAADKDSSGRHYLQYLQALRSMDDRSSIEKLADRLALDLDRRIGSLSHGNRQKIGLVQALMHEPAVLILDEPTAGLDPLVQRTFLDMLDERRTKGCAILLSSHVLSEVEAIADRVGFLREGELIDDRMVDELRRDAPRRLDLRFDHMPAEELLRRVPGVTRIRRFGDSVEVVIAGSLSELMTAAAPYGVQSIVTHEADLEDLFLSHYDTEM